MTNIEINKRKIALKAANAISKVEGASTSVQAERIFSLWADGKLTGEQMKEQVLALYKKN